MTGLVTVAQWSRAFFVHESAMAKQTEREKAPAGKRSKGRGQSVPEKTIDESKPAAAAEAPAEADGTETAALGFPVVVTFVDIDKLKRSDEELRRSVRDVSEHRRVEERAIQSERLAAIGQITVGDASLTGAEIVITLLRGGDVMKNNAEQGGQP